MPGGYKKLRPEDNPKPFNTHPENIGGGRKKKIYTILKEKGYSLDDVKAAFGELAFYTIGELQEVIVDDTKPAIARIVANQFVHALKNADWTKIKEILEHVIGKPTQVIKSDEDNFVPATIIFEVNENKINKNTKTNKKLSK